MQCPKCGLGFDLVEYKQTKFECLACGCQFQINRLGDEEDTLYDERADLP